MKTFFLSLAAAMALVSGARAEVINIEAQWSGAGFSNGASATATFALDTALFNNPGFSSFVGSSFASAFQNFQLSVTGASLGNGVFSGSDFSTIFLNTAGGTLDFHSDLVGQSTPAGLWGFASSGSNGDFNLFSTGVSSLTPTGSSIFTLLTGGGERMSLTSFSPASASPVAVPETGTWVMGLLGVGVFFVLVRRKSAQVA